MARFVLPVLVAALLILFGPAVCAGENLSGAYDVSGINPNGSRYKGTATITIGEKKCRVNWKIPATTAYGNCELKGDQFTVYFTLNGAKGVVVYKLQRNGTLVGSWWMNTSRKSKGRETLRPRRPV